jgi:pimeloyl-ACP methyl ester carboxylesterase
MPLMPFQALGIWLRGLLAVAILAGGAGLAYAWYRDAYVWVPDRVQVVGDSPAPGQPGPALVGAETVATGHREFRFHPGFNVPTAELLGALALLTWGLAGGLIARGLARLRLPEGKDDPRRTREGAEVRRIERPDGTELHVELYGPPDAPPIVLTHGWGADATEWYYEKKRLAGRFRLITWDLAGLGLSKKPDDNDFSLEKMARDLDAVLELAGGRPAVLLGHSIGGMILLTYCRLFPAALATRVAGLVLVHTTYTDPIRTTEGAWWKTKLEGPVLVPALTVMIGLWPLVWLMNWLSYLNGSFHRSTHKQSFAGTETRGQLDFAAGFLPRARPDVLARGMFGMMDFDEAATLPTIVVPTLVVAADLDITCKPEASETIALGVPGASIVTLSPARHMGVIERNEEFDAAVAEFADACASRAPGPVVV